MAHHPFLTHLAQPFSTPIRTLQEYSRRKFRLDLQAGLTVSVLEVPQAMAYAVIAHVPPQYGLYASVIQGLLGALFSSNQHLATGPTNTHCLLIASVATAVADPSNSELYLHVVFALSLIKGLMQLAFGMAQMGYLVRFVSHSVIVGFTAGAGVLIAMGQLPHFLGMQLPAGGSNLPGALGDLHRLFLHVDAVHMPALGLGLLTVGIVLGMKWLSPLLPGSLLGVVAAAVVVWWTGWAQTQAVPLIPSVPRSLPVPFFPPLHLMNMESLFTGALALAMLGIIETVAIGKAMSARTGERINANQEFFSQGLANTFGGLLQCIPGTGSFTRSALSFYAGGVTRFAGVFNALFVATMVLLLGPASSYVPLASLAGVLFLVSWSLIDWPLILRIFRTSRSDSVVLLITFTASLLLPLKYAIFAGIFLSIGLYLRKASRLHMAEMVRSQPFAGSPFIERPVHDRLGQKQVMFLQIEGDLFFGLADELQDRLDQLSAGEVRVVILRLKRTHSIDSTVLRVFEDFARRMRERDRFLVLCGVRPELMQPLRSFGLEDVIGRDNIFPAGLGVFTSAKQALQRARILVGSSIDIAGMDFDEDGEVWTYHI